MAHISRIEWEVRTVWMWADNLQKDLRFAARALRNNLGFTSIVVATLALGIGANTTIFSIVNGILLKPLPFSDPARLSVLFEKTPSSQRGTVSYPNFQDWQRTNHSFSSLAAFRKDNFVMTGESHPERLRAAMISSDLLSTLGIKPVIGREFLPEEDALGAGRVALVSEAFWRKRFGAAPDILGRTLQLNGASYTVIGVMPHSVETLRFPFFTPGEVYVPLGQWSDPSFRDRKVTTGMYAVGRLAPHVPESSAAAEMAQIAANLEAAYPEANRHIGMNMVPLHEFVVGGLEPMLLVLLFTVSFVLLISCVNVANLLLARSTGRIREFATRTALGGSQRRIAAQLLTESVFLSLLGGMIGLILAAAGTRAALAWVPAEIPRADSIGMDSHVMLFTFAVSVSTGILFGVAPIAKIWRLNLSETLKEGGRGSSGTRHKAQHAFVVVEVALALILLVGAGLMSRSLEKLWRVHPGFDPHNVLAFDITPSPVIAADAQKIRILFRHLTERLETVPGVDSASLLLDPLPLTGVADSVPFDVEGHAIQTNEKEKISAIWYFVSADYFRTMGIPLKRGRLFQVSDNENAPRVALIDEAFAASMFPNQDPIGRRITIKYTGTSEIVGVVAHVNHWNLGGDPPASVQLQMYFPFAQLPDKYLPLGIEGGATVLLHTHSDPLSFRGAVQDQASQLDQGLAMFDVRTLEEVIGAWLSTRRFAMTLLSVFAALALALSTIGVYGVISYMVGQRTHEIGIRMTLGAEPSDILRLIVGQGGRLALLGIGLGAIAAHFLARLMVGMLYGVNATDSPTLVAATSLLVLVALAASYIPARRAMRVNPASSLRS